MSNDLPRWDLSLLLSNCEEAINILQEMQKEVASLSEEVNRAISPPINPEHIRDIIVRMEKILHNTGIASSYIYLRYAQNTQDNTVQKYMAKLMMEEGEIEGYLAKITSALIGLGSETLSSLMEHPSLDNYKHFIKKLIQKAPHTFSPEGEQIIAIKNSTGRSGAVKLYDTLSGKLGAEKDDSFIPMPKIRAMRMSKDKGEREWAWNTMLKILGENKYSLGGLFTIVAMDWDKEAEIRKYPTPVSMRNVENDVDDDVVDIMSDITRSRNDIPQRYWQWKSKKLGYDNKLPLTDLFAPLGEGKTFTWEEAKDAVLTSLSEFDNEIYEIVKEFFEEDRIDAPITPGKMGGAFCMYQSPGAPVYVMVNFSGNARDVATLAHELGHGVHGVLSGKQTPLNFHPPLALAEVASTFGEFLLHDYFRKTYSDKENEIASKIEDIIGTVFRQNTFHIFEKEAHSKVTGEGWGVDELSKLYLETYGALFGESVEYPETYANEWVGIPHFLHTPFYVYSYTLAELISLLIFKRYKENYPGFKEKYKELLAAGGSQNPHKLLKDLMNIDIKNPHTWEEALNFIEDYFLSYLK